MGNYRQSVLLKECGWLDIAHLTKYHSLLQLWKTVWWGIPTYMKDRITQDTENRLETQLPRLLITRMSYRHSTVLTWNSMPAHLRAERKISTFKRGIKRWLMECMEEQNKPPDNE